MQNGAGYIKRRTGAGVIASLFHGELVDAMIEVASEVLKLGGADVVDVMRVPGAYEMPLAAQKMLDDERVNLVVVLGYIERGDTLHGEVMAHVVLRSLVDLQLRYGKPMGLGIIGPGATAEQAEVRKIGYAGDAARAALHMLSLFSEQR